MPSKPKLCYLATVRRKSKSKSITASQKGYKLQIPWCCYRHQSRLWNASRLRCWQGKENLKQNLYSIKGREGLSVKIGIDLYKSLVRPHLQYAIPVWASISEKDVMKMEKVQVDCLRRIIGAKAHSSSAAIEVVCGIVPFRFRKRELCCREYIRIQAKSHGCKLIKLMEASTRVGL